MLHHQVDQVLELATGGLDDQACIAVVYKLHNVRLVKTSQNLDFISEGLKVVVGPLYKVLLQNFDCDLLWLNCFVLGDTEVDLRGVALSDLLSD